MSKLKHTPGPWEYRHNNTIWRETHRNKDDLLCHQPVCDVDVPAALPLDEKEANSRLIAAAPEMLELLINDCRNDYLKQTDNPMIGSRALYCKHKYIIEKATGLPIDEVMKDE